MLFRKKQKELVVTPNQMGELVYIVASKRSDEFYKYCENSSFNLEPIPLLQYSMIYNFFFIREALYKKYSRELSNSIIDFALNSVYIRTEELFGLEFSQHTEKIVFLTLYELSDFFQDKPSLRSDNWLQALAKMFLRDTSSSESDLFDFALVLDVSIEIGSWMENEYLTSEYLVK